MQKRRGRLLTTAKLRSPATTVATLQAVDSYEFELASDFEDEEIDEEAAFTEEDKKLYAGMFGSDAAAEVAGGEPDDLLDSDEDEDAAEVLRQTLLLSCPTSLDWAVKRSLVGGRLRRHCCIITASNFAALALAVYMSVLVLCAGCRRLVGRHRGGRRPRRRRGSRSRH